MNNAVLSIQAEQGLCGLAEGRKERGMKVANRRDGLRPGRLAAMGLASLNIIKDCTPDNAAKIITRTIKTVCNEED